MNDLLSLIVHHGYIIICLIVFAEAIGVPVPGAVALVAGGAAAASGALYGPAVALLAVMAMLLADSFALRSWQPHGMDNFEISVPDFSRSGNMCFARRGVVL